VNRLRGENLTLKKSAGEASQWQTFFRVISPPRGYFTGYMIAPRLSTWQTGAESNRPQPS